MQIENKSQIDNKYDYPIELSQSEISQNKTTYSIIANWIKENSRVLELGPYKGRLTRYLTEQKKCDVFVIERDEEAFEVCSNFASDGVCADLETIDFDRVLENRSFDYVVIADVLEHLSNPLGILMAVKKFLNRGGEILFSVPNIAHSDVISNLLQDRFQYTNIGLLDTTHIHFFSRETVRKMIAEARLSFLCEDCTVVSPYQTEQGQYLDINNMQFVSNLMAIHKTGAVYQYVCRTSIENKEDFVSHVEERIANDKTMVDCIKLYYNLGEGYSEKLTSVYFADKDNCVSIREKIPESCFGIRFDPSDSQKCLVNNLRVVVDGNSVITTNLNGLRFGNKDIFFRGDPQIEIPLKGRERYIEIKAEITPITYGNFSIIEDVFIEMQKEKLRESKHKYEKNF